MANRITTILDLDGRGFDSSLKSLRKQIADTDGTFNKFKVGASGTMDAIKANAGSLALGAGAALTAFGAKAVDAASDLGESMNAVDVTFKDAAESIHALGETSVDSFGLSERAFNDAAVQFSSFAKTVAGTSGDVSKTMAALVGRATDFASVMNIDVGDAMALFQSSLAGESEPIRRYGKDLSAAAVEQYALAKGLIESKDELTETIKVQARYGLLMEATSDTAGDFANTQGSLANQSKTLGAQFEDLSASAGTVLVPALSAVAEKLIVIAELAESMGWAVDGLKNVINPAVKSADEYDQRVKELGLGRDEDGNLVRLSEAVDANTRSFTKAEIEANKLANSHRGIVDAAHESTDGYDKHKRALEGASDAVSIINDAIESSIDAHDRETEAIHRVNDARREGTDNIYAAKEAEDAWWETIQAGTAALEDAELGAREKAAALRDVATATDEVVSAQLVAQGVDLASVVGQEAWLEAMLETAEGLSGPMKTEVLNYLALMTGLPAEFLAAGTNIGNALGDGVQAGIESRTGAVQRAAEILVEKAVNASKTAGKIHSPSKVMADEVGKPLAEGVAVGIEESADKIGDALAKAITSAEKKALDAAQDLVDDVKDGIDGFWGGIDDQRSEADMRDAVVEANEALAEAVESGDLEKIADAKERLEDANYRLAKATVDMIYVDAQSRKSWEETAAAAGLSKMEIDGLIAAYDALALAKANAATTSNGITAAAGSGMSTIDRFEQLVGQGLVSPEQVAWVGAGKTDAEKLAGMQGIIGNLDAMFGTPSSGSGPNITIQSFGTSDEYTRRLAAEIQRILRESK